MTLRSDTMSTQPTATEADLKRWEELFEKPTRGPWEASGRMPPNNWIYASEAGGQRRALFTVGHNTGEQEGNAAFIAAAREGWPLAVRTVRSQAGEMERMRKALESIAQRGANRTGQGNREIACLALGGHVGGKQCDEPQSEVCLHCERCGHHFSDAATAAAAKELEGT